MQPGAIVMKVTPVVTYKKSRHLAAFFVCMKAVYCAFAMLSKPIS